MWPIDGDLTVTTLSQSECSDSERYSTLTIFIKPGPHRQMPFSVLPRNSLGPFTYLQSQSAGAIKHTDCISTPMSVVDMTDGELSGMRELWTMLITPLMPSLPRPLLPGIVTPNWVLFMGRIQHFDIKAESKQMTHTKLSCLK